MLPAAGRAPPRSGSPFGGTGGFAAAPMGGGAVCAKSLPGAPGQAPWPSGRWAQVCAPGLGPGSGAVGSSPTEGPAQIAAWRPPRRGASCCGDSCWSGRREQVGTRWHHAGPSWRDTPLPPDPVPPRAQACCQGSSPRYSPAHPAVRDQSGSSQGAPPTLGEPGACPGLPGTPSPPPSQPTGAEAASGETPGAGLRRRGGGAAPTPSVPLLRPHPCVLEFSRCCLVPQIVSCCSPEGAKSAIAYVAVSVTSLPDSPLFGFFVF